MAVLTELADVCNKVGMIEKGLLFVNGRVEEVMQQVRQAIVLHVRVTATPDQAAKLTESHDDVGKVSVNSEGMLIVTLKKGESIHVDGEIVLRRDHGNGPSIGAPVLR